MIGVTAPLGGRVHADVGTEDNRRHRLVQSQLSDDRGVAAAETAELGECCAHLERGLVQPMAAVRRAGGVRQAHADDEQALLGPVVEVTLEAAACVVGTVDGCRADLAKRVEVPGGRREQALCFEGQHDRRGDRCSDAPLAPGGVLDGRHGDATPDDSGRGPAGVASAPSPGKWMSSARRRR